MTYPFVFHPQYLDYWLVTGICEFWGRFYYKVEDRNRQKQDFLPITAKLIPQQVAYKAITERLLRNYKVNAGLCTLNSGDQPSLLIED